MKLSKEDIQRIVDEFMKDPYNDFIRNEHGAYVYSNGPHSISLRYILEDLIDFAINKSNPTEHGDC